MIEKTMVPGFDEMAASLSAKDFFSAEDYAWIESLAGFWEREDETPVHDDDYEVLSTCADLAQDLLDSNPRAFEYSLEFDEGVTRRHFAASVFARLAIMGLEYGVACEDGACANYLGSLFYMGEFVPLDYERAKELYELAERKGVEQAMLNLGYIYEYGRTGTPDHQKAFSQYAKVAALTGSPEALYKLGDMYSRAKVVERDLRTAYRLYRRSLAEAEGNVGMQAQAAIRMAKLVSDEYNVGWGIPYDPMWALELYQLAERGLRIDIARGQTYYRKRLQEALDGQDRMRCVLDGPEIWL